MKIFLTEIWGKKIPIRNTRYHLELFTSKHVKRYCIIIWRTSQVVAKMDVVNSNVGGVGQASHSFNYNLQNRVKRGQEKKENR